MGQGREHNPVWVPGAGREVAHVRVVQIVRSPDLVRTLGCTRHFHIRFLFSSVFEK